MDIEKTAAELDQRVSAMIDRGLEAHDEQAFNALALDMFAYQYEANEYYRQLCDRVGVKPGSISRWEDIPALPTRAFKESVVASIAPENSDFALMTSGTSDPNLRGKVFQDKSSLANIIKANNLVTKAYCFPEFEKMTLGLLIPPPTMVPGMAMAFGMGFLLKSFGNEKSRYFISEKGLDIEGLCTFLKESVDTQEPICLTGATSGFVMLFNHLREIGGKYQLPKGSLVLDGGGYQGTFGACSREDFYRLCKEFLGVEEHHCVNGLGMAECGTNYIDCVLADHLAGRTDRERQKISPPWARTMVVGMRTGKPLPVGEIGLIRHIDVTNRATVVAIQTENLGYQTAEGFEIIGRADQVTSVKDIAFVAGKAGRQMPPQAAAAAAAGMPHSHACSTVTDQVLAHSHACSTVTDKVLAHSHACSTVTDQVLAHSHACSTVTDKVLAHSHACSTVTDKILAKTGTE